MSWLGWTAALAVILLALAAAFAAARLQMAVRTRNAYTARVVEHPLVGQPAPPLRLAQATGGEADLADLRGRTVAVAFWSSF